MSNTQRPPLRRFRPAGPPAAAVQPSAAPRTPPAPARDEAPAASKRKKQFQWDRLPIAFFGYLILGLWWLAGGKWTIDGSPLLVNAILDFFRIKVALPPVTNPTVYLLLCWLPAGISYVEHKYSPWRAVRKWGILALVFVLGIWLIVTAADWSSTWLALTHPEPGAWRIAQQVAAIPALAAVCTTLTTFVPEIGAAVLAWWLWE